MVMPKFKSEDDFRQNWIAPFLTKLGYILVTHSHGAHEQGKDFFFADYDRFDHLRFYAAQVKNGDIGAGDVELDKLLNQVKRCFQVDLRYKETNVVRISAVYLMASGKISHDAKEYITGWCRREHYGENVFYLDGPRLEQLDRFATQQDDRTVRQRLVGLLNESVHNIERINIFIRASAQKRKDFVTCRTAALERAIASPLPDNLVPYAVLDSAWTLLDFINGKVDPLPIRYKDETFEQFRQIGDRAHEANLRIRDACHDAIRTLDEKYAIGVSVEATATDGE